MVDSSEMETDPDELIKRTIAAREVYRRPWPALIVFLLAVVPLVLHGVGLIALPAAVAEAWYGYWGLAVIAGASIAYFLLYRRRLRALSELDSEALWQRYLSFDYPLPNSLFINYLRLKLRHPKTSFHSLYHLKRRSPDGFGKIVEAFFILRKSGLRTTANEFFASVDSVEDACASIHTHTYRM